MSMIIECPFCKKGKKGIMKPIDLELKYWAESYHGNIQKTIEAFECDRCGWIAFKRKEG